MEAISYVILIGSTLLILSILTSFAAIRIGAPLLLIFLGVGLLAGEDGIGGLLFDDVEAAFLIGSMALAVILFESGFDTKLQSYKAAAWPALSLATLGVAVTTGAVGTAAHLLLALPWTEALLLGAVVSSTDAAAVFFLLRVGGITIRDRVRSTLEIESGSNDPTAILLTLVLAQAAADGWGDASHIALEFVRQIGLGAAFGLAGGVMIVAVINAARLDPGINPVISLAFALFIFAGTNVLGGSGFLAVYAAGLVAGNSALRGGTGLRRFHSGLAWLGQIVMFVMLGLLAAPHEFLDVLAPATALAAILILVARPLGVWLCLLPFRFTANETTFIAWVGLRGAVSLLLALVPILNGLESGRLILNVTFVVVIASLLVQGWTIGPMARWLRLIVPPRSGPVDRVELELPGEANHELVAYTVHPRSTAARGQRPPRWARPSLVIRDGRVVPVHRARILQGGDHVYVFSAPGRVPMLDRLYGGARPIDGDDRDFFGDLVLSPEATVEQIAVMYGLPLSLPLAGLTLAELFRQEFGGAVEPGDRLRMGSVELIVRDMEEDGVIAAIGMALEPTPVSTQRVVLFRRPREIMTALGNRWGRIRFGRWQKRQNRRRRSSEDASPP